MSEGCATRDITNYRHTRLVCSAILSSMPPSKGLLLLDIEYMACCPRI